MKNKARINIGKLLQLNQKGVALQEKIDRQNFNDITADDARKLIEELHSYQIELEMQNEQLQMVSEQLANSVIKYEDLYDFAPVGYVTLDEFGLVLEANLTCSKLLATDRRLILNMHLSRYITPDGFSVFANFLKNMKESDLKQTCEVSFKRPDQSILEIRLEGLGIMARSPEVIQFRVALIDITEQKKAELNLIESQRFVQRIADTMPDILTVYDLEKQKNVYGNREIETLLGPDPAKIKVMDSSKLLDLVHPDDLEGFRRNMQATRFLHDGEVSEFEYRIRNRQGRYIWLRVRSVPFLRAADGLVSQILSVQQDITLRKETEEDLRFKNQIVNNLQENLPIIVSVIKPDGTFLDMTGSGMSALEKEGITCLKGQNIYELFPKLRPNLETVFLEGKKVSYVQCVGKENKTCFRNYVFLDKTQNAAISFSIDITDQMAAEKIIIAEREFSRNLLNNSVDGILAFDADLKITAWNKVMEKLTKIPEADILGEKVFERFPLFENSEVGLAMVQVLQGQHIVLHDLKLQTKNGMFEAYLNPLVNETGQVTGGLCILHNISLQKKLEAESTRLKLEQQKEVLNAVLETQEEERRRIAESLHNGVGQLLYAAKLNLQSKNLSQPENIKLYTRLLDEAINETRTISFELMPRVLEDFGLETALEELLKRISTTNVKFSLHTNGLKRFADNIEIAVYRIMQELINNIIKHARATTVMLELTCSNKTLHLVVKDNGIGFEVNSMAERTKGIGLTSIRNRVKLLDGKMEIESEPGKGTTISIALKLP